MFGVYRDQAAMAHLRRAWEEADEPLRTEILLAMERVDRELQSGPHGKGESRPGGTRILFEAPVAVVFEVDEAKNLVRILRAWVYRDRSLGYGRAA